VGDLDRDTTEKPWNSATVVILHDVFLGALAVPAGIFGAFPESIFGMKSFGIIRFHILKIPEQLCSSSYLADILQS